MRNDDLRVEIAELEDEIYCVSHDLALAEAELAGMDEDSEEYIPYEIEVADLQSELDNLNCRLHDLQLDLEEEEAGV